MLSTTQFSYRVRFGQIKSTQYNLSKYAQSNLFLLLLLLLEQLLSKDLPQLCAGSTCFAGSRIRVQNLFGQPFLMALQVALCSTRSEIGNDRAETRKPLLSILMLFSQFVKSEIITIILYIIIIGSEAFFYPY